MFDRATRPSSRKAPSPATGRGRSHVLDLQRSVGNRGVAALLGGGAAQRLPEETNPSGVGPARRRRPPARLLHVGSRGPAVRRLQQRLGVDADGVFGSRTRAAVIEVQRGAGLTPDGIVGPATAAVLGRASGSSGVAPGDVAAVVVSRLRAIAARLQQLDAEAEVAPVAEPAPEVEPMMVPARNDLWDDAEEWWDETTETAEEVWDETTEAAGEAAEWVEETAEEVWDETTEAAGEAADWVEETAGEAADWVEETAEEAWDTTVEVAGQAAEAVESAVDYVMDDVLPALGDAVRDLIEDPIGVLSDLADRVRDGLANGFGSDIIQELEDAWNSLFGGDDDEAATSSSGTIPSIGPSTLPRSCPKSDGPPGGRPLPVRIHLDWRPSAPTEGDLDGGSGDFPPELVRSDRLTAGLVFRGAISQSLPVGSVVQFGREEPSLVVEAIHWDQDDGVVDVRGVVRLDCRWNVKSHGRIDVPSADSSVVTKETWVDIVLDLTPGAGDQPPRSTYWASDIVGEHEFYHGAEDVLHARSMVDDGSAVRGIDGRPIVDPESQLPELMQLIHDRIGAYMQDQYKAGGEGRAYGATAHLYRQRVEQIEARAEREGWIGGS